MTVSAALRGIPVSVARQEQATDKPKRLTLDLNQPLYAELEAIAERESKTVTEVMREAVKFRMFVDKVKNSSGTKLLIRENNADREIMFL